MKTYLADFFKTLCFEREDAAYLCGVYDCIVADAQADEAFKEAIDLYGSADFCDHTRILALADRAAERIGVHEYTTELLIYICLSETLRERYCRRGIDTAVFECSMLDLRYKLEECKAVKGIVGSFVAPWFAGFFDMTRFALGRLQFEIVPFEATFEQDGRTLTPDSKVINIHIPRTGTPLDERECDEAFQKAAVFFADAVGDAPAFVCRSWLLYPENRRIFSPHSNIVRFMSRFTIVSWGIDTQKSDLWRLFDTDEQHLERLPTDTTARRQIVAHLKAGGKLGWGYGVFLA